MIYAENILLCIAIPLLVSLVYIRGEARRFIQTFLFGMIVCLLAAYISGFLNLVNGMSAEDTAVFISPVVEEIMKFLPLLFLLLMFNLQDEHLILSATGIGAGFGTFENCCYILTNGAGNLAYVMIRGMAVGVMHIVSMLTLATGLILARRLKALNVPSVIGALSLSTTFHALYNLLVSEQGLPAFLGYALPLFTAVLLYVPYKRLLAIRR